MAMFVVVYFVFDQTVEVLSSLKVNQNESNTLKIGEECEVPYETEGITDDGSTVIEEKNYIGKILWLCEAKKSATTVANKISNQLKEGLKIENLIYENQQKFGKCDCGTKMKEAIDQLREEPVINKKGTKRSGQLKNVPQVEDLPTAAKKQRTSKSKAEKQKSNTTETTSSATAKKVAISAEKIAEIGELLGTNEIITINPKKTPPPSPRSIITPKKSPRVMNNLHQKDITPIHSKQGKSTEHGKLVMPPFATGSSASTSKMVTPKKSTPKKSTPKKSPRLNITPRKSPRVINNLPQKDITPIHSKHGRPPFATGSSASTSKMVTPKKSTPKKSPRSNITPRKSPRVINDLPQKDITPIHSTGIQGKSTEHGKLVIPPFATGSSASTSKMVTPKKSTPKKSTTKKLSLPDEDFPPENRWDGMFTGSTRVLLDLDNQTSTNWHIPDDGLQNNSIETTCSKSQEKICDLLGISETEAVVASKIFRKVADLLDGDRTEDGHMNDDIDYLNRESYTVDNSIEFQDDHAVTADTSYREEIAAVDVTPTKPKTPKKKEDPKKENHKHKWIFS